jgi:hypothetical protein
LCDDKSVANSIGVTLSHLLHVHGYGGAK